MSNGISNQHGPYMHADGAKRTKKHGERNFTVLIAGAYNAGIIGPEHNGLVVIDEDNRNVVLDQHFKDSTGYFGPSDRQQAELQRVMAMDWSDFRSFIKENPRYRKGSVPDIDMQTPDPVIGIEDRVIYAKEGREPNGAYSEPLENRKPIIEYIRDHGMHKIDGQYSKFALAWDIKVGSFDTSGKNAPDEFVADEQFDERWEAHVENDTELFGQSAENGIRMYTDREYTLYPGVNQGDYGFERTGRSAGWLILTEFDGLEGKKLSWDSMHDIEEWLQNLPDEKLVHLYRLVNQLDADLSKDKIMAEMAYQYAFARESLEDQWSQEVTPTLA